MAKLCLEELEEKGRVGKVESRWEEEKRKFFKERG